MDNRAHKASDDDVADAFTEETRFGTTWILLWLVAKAERHVVARAIIGDRSNDAVGGEALRRWAEPQLAAFRRDEGVPMIPWRRVAKLLRYLPCDKG